MQVIWDHRVVGVVVSVGMLAPVLAVSAYGYVNGSSETEGVPLNNGFFMTIGKSLREIGLRVILRGSLSMDAHILARCFGKISIYDVLVPVLS